MAFWGLYYDLFNFANFDFVSRYRNEKHSTSFGIISVFKNLGYALAPLIAGLAIIEYVGWKPFMLAFIFAVIALILFFTLIFSIHNDELGRDKEKGCTKSNIFTELRYWKKIGIYIWPLLAMSALITMSEAFFWTIGPIFSESFLFDQFNGLFFAAYTIPPLITGWIVGNISERMGKKKTAYLSFMAGSILLAGLAFTRNPYILIIIIFIASIFLSISWPSINGAYADYVFESSGVEKEIEGIEGFFSNIGFIIGPPLAGFLADYIGNIEAFAVFGIIASLAAFILMTFTPRQINIKIMG